MDIPPPPYQQVKNFHAPNHTNRDGQGWYQRLISLQFTEQEAIEYSEYFRSNDISISMIPELNDSVLKSIGIEKAGHRIRILRLQKSRTPAATSNEAVILTCAMHPNVVASEKCRTCGRLVCLQCRRERIGNGGTRYYCNTCYNDCVIL